VSYTGKRQIRKPPYSVKGENADDTSNWLFSIAKIINILEKSKGIIG
jgi:hypothetical protein